MEIKTLHCLPHANETLSAMRKSIVSLIEKIGTKNNVEYTENKRSSIFCVLRKVWKTANYKVCSELRLRLNFIVTKWYCVQLCLFYPYYHYFLGYRNAVLEVTRTDGNTLQFSRTSSNETSDSNERYQHQKVVRRYELV